MEEVSSYNFPDLTPSMNRAWKNLDFSGYEQECNQIDSVLSKLFHQLKKQDIDCVWFENDYERVVWTRSLKEAGAVQLTSFSTKFKTANSDEQVSDVGELLHCLAEHSIYKGVQVHAGVSETK